MLKSHSILHKEKDLQDSKKTADINDSNTQKQTATQIRDIVISAIEDAKGNDLKLLDVAHLTAITDYMMITSGTSNRHIQTIAETAMKKAAEQGFEKIGIEGLGQSEWVVVDFADVVLHIMSPAAREHYNIEGLWDISLEDCKPNTE
jgi:ribosome-associated protein